MRRLIDGWELEPNVSLWARRLGCTRPNIRYHLKRHGKRVSQHLVTFNSETAHREAARQS